MMKERRIAYDAEKDKTIKKYISFLKFYTIIFRRSYKIAP
jgi:hypothetical protein